MWEFLLGLVVGQAFPPSRTEKLPSQIRPLKIKSIKKWTDEQISHQTVVEVNASGGNFIVYHVPSVITDWRSEVRLEGKTLFQDVYDKDSQLVWQNVYYGS